MKTLTVRPLLGFLTLLMALAPIAGCDTIDKFDLLGDIQFDEETIAIAPNEEFIPSFSVNDRAHQKLNINEYEYAYSSFAEDIATYTNGVLKGLSVGMTVITIEIVTPDNYHNKHKSTMYVTVMSERTCNYIILI